MQTGTSGSEEVVVLLDDDLKPCGTAPKAGIHTTHTPLHLAFSLYLFNDAGELLMTRRALHKKTWPAVWSNSCCGHPALGESLEQAVRRRLAQELRVGVDGLVEVLPNFRYRATDASGIVENEYCPVFAGTVSGEVDPDSEEIVEHAWLSWRTVQTLANDAPALISPWCVDQVRELGPSLVKRLGEAGR